MSNHITASIEFYFKGERFNATVELDIDQYMQTTGKLPALYPLLSRSLKLDPYSYEYEMLQAEPILFSEAKGLIAQYVDQGTLDFDAFKIAWAETRTLEKLQDIAQRNMSIDNIEQQPELKNALLEAYQLGITEKSKA
jgi:hypothetical protein